MNAQHGKHVNGGNVLERVGIWKVGSQTYCIKIYKGRCHLVSLDSNPVAGPLKSMFGTVLHFPEFWSVWGSLEYNPEHLKIITKDLK
jgi:hypothetical protein